MSPRKISQSFVRSNPAPRRLRQSGNDRGRPAMAGRRAMPMIAGTIHSELCLRRARALRAGAVD
ncbi:MAG TPA: hypothetical protein VFV83_04150, partial [Chthoniobacteraceae bacterium]|nr:hypothetical protein [Chthoniobacteraceae bacterium]